NPKSGIRNQESEIRNPKSLLPPWAFFAAFAFLVFFAALLLSAFFFQTDRTAGAIAGAGFQQRCVVLIGLHESFICGARYSAGHSVNMTNLTRCNDFLQYRLKIGQ
ncbi:MAG TPA: hypothetical protein PK198_08365, partial [Saprospiraceae bacterium]|nr:hypothetical protein [Saprospiraceae bacterium]HRK82027.1 hypothetical protein [Saprospiraceae bacterium]